MQRADLYPNITRTQEFLKMRGKVRQYFARTIAQAQKAGVLAPLDPQVAGDLLLGMIRSLQRFSEPQRTVEENANIVLSVFLDGMSRRTMGNGHKKCKPMETAGILQH